MRERTKTALGIEFGAHHISVAVVEKSPQGLRTLAAASEDVPVAGPGSSPDKTLSRLVSQVGRRARLGGIRAAVAVSAEPLVVRLLDLPDHVPANIGAWVRNELQQYVVLSGKTLVSDFCGVGAGMQKRLLVAAGDADRLHEMVKVCRAAGIVVDAVEPALLAYVRAFRERQNEARHAGQVLIAMLGARTLTIGLLRRGTLDFVRTRDLPADARRPREWCTWLADELRAVWRYDETQVGPAGRAGQVHMVIHDGTHRADELAPLLAAEVGTTTLTVADAREPVTRSGPVTDNPPISTASRVAEGAALALLGVEGDDSKVNLLPPAETEARARSRHLLVTANVCVVLFLAIFLVAQLLTQSTRAMDRRIEQSRISGELYAAPALIAEERFLDQEIAGLRQRLDPWRKATDGRGHADWPGIFDAVRQAAPVGVSVTQVQGDGSRTLSVKGLACSCPAAERFVRNLETQPPFAFVSLSFVQRRQDSSGGLEYRIECRLKRKGGESS